MVDRQRNSIFDGFGSSTLKRPTYSIDWNSPSGRVLGLSQANAMTNGFGYEASQNNPFGSLPMTDSQRQGAGSSSQGNTFNAPSLLSAIPSAGEGIMAGINNQYSSAAAGNGFGLVDNTLAGGRKNKVGMAAVNTGATLMNTGLQSGNPWLILGGGVAGALGTFINAGWGLKENKENIAMLKDNMNRARSVGSKLDGTGSTDSFLDVAGSASSRSGFAPSDLVKGGWFSKGKASRKGQEYLNDESNAISYQDNALASTANAIESNQKRNVQASRTYSLGGPFGQYSDDTLGAIEYSFINDYLTQKKRQNDIKNRTAGMVSLPAFMPNSFAIGGDLQTNGADWNDGLVTIGAGGSHEENPNEGIQMGVDNENVPNLVEEGETVFNDYVFSNRILADEATKQMFRLPKKKDITFADISKRLEKEIEERPNDPISKSGFEKQMQMLEEQQERQKQEMEAERAKAAFEALSPEEQTALMQQRAEQEAMAQQAMQEAAAQQQPTGQPTPEEVAMAQQQQMMADGSEAALGQEPENLTLLQQNVSALGGELVKAGDVEPNRFDYGGKKGSRKAKRIARKYDEQWFKNMAKSLGISDKEMEGFVYSADDPEANLASFNNIYRDNQYNKSKDIYRKGQRQSKRNELFGDNGLYSYSDDKSKIYKARTNDSDRIGWVSKDYTGAVDSDGNMLGFLSQEDYDKLKPNEKEAYRRINERAGDRMHDYNGKVIRDLYNDTEENLLNSFDADYDKGFKWDDKDAQTLQYPVDMKHSATSAMRYIPAIGGAIGLGYDLLSSPDYSRPQAIIEASRELATPSQVQPHYVGNYLTYRPLDIWYQQNALNAQSRATDRALTNNSGGNRGTAMAGLLANGYNSQLASGNLFRQAQEYNDSLKQKVEDFNRGTNIFNANADMDSQKTNAMLREQAGRIGLQGLMTGYGMMDDIDARRQASISANLTNVLQSLGNIGEEAYDEDKLRWLERTGTLKSRTLSANGGKLKKRGLTI